jgi:hypothetical protein
MDNIGQILWKTFATSLPELIKLFFAVFAAGLLGARLNDKFARQRDRATGIEKDRKPLITAIDKMIDNVMGIDNPSMIVNYLHRLYDPYSVFRYHVTSERLIAYNKAWDTIRGTTHQELMGSRGQAPYKKGDQELHKLQQIIISRLEDLKKIAKEN